MSLEAMQERFCIMTEEGHVPEIMALSYCRAYGSPTDFHALEEWIESTRKERDERAREETLKRLRV